MVNNLIWISKLLLTMKPRSSSPQKHWWVSTVLIEDGVHFSPCFNVPFSFSRLFHFTVQVGILRSLTQYVWGDKFCLYVQMHNDFVTNNSARLWDTFLLLFVICIFWTAFISYVGPFWGFSKTLASRVMWQCGSGGPLEDDLQGQSNTVWVREHESIIATKRKKDMNSVSFVEHALPEIRILLCCWQKKLSVFFFMI